MSKIYKIETEGNIVRSRIKWFEEGEQSSKFFFDLETHRGKSKLITKIKDKTGKIVTDTAGILKSHVDFYEELYKSEGADVNAQDFLLNKLDIEVSENSKNACDGFITLEEANNALDGMTGGKSPGSDGFGKCFYEKFWYLLGEHLVDVLNESYRNTCLSETQKLAVITLLYKDGDKSDLKNWRPISLLNVDYKILAKIVANRLKKYIGEIIHPDQTCGVKGRTIFENIIFAQDAIFFANEYNKPLCILSLDQTKAFDRVNRSFLFKTLEKFGFGDNFITWVKTLYFDTRSKILVNGHVSNEHF